MKEYDIFSPLCFNDGTRVEGHKLQESQRQLLEEFDGVTFFPQPNEGLWRMGDVTYRDEIVIYRVVTRHLGKARRFLRQLKESLKRSLKQEEIFIIERDVEAL